MSDEMETRIQEFNLNLASLLEELQTGLAVDIEKLMPIIVEAYKKDLSSSNTGVQILDEVIAIVNIGDDADDISENKFRKIRQLLVAKGLVEN